MNLLNPDVLLRRALLADAAVSGLTGVMLLSVADLLGGLLDLPASLLRYTGLVLLPFAAMVLYVAKQTNPQRSGARAVVILNAGWVLASFLLLFSGFVSPSALGVAFVVFQALVVAVFAEVQHMALRRVVTAG